MSRKNKGKSPGKVRAVTASAPAQLPRRASRVQPSGGRAVWWPGAALVAAVFIAYWPAMHGGFLWDDDTHISRNDTLRSLSGLWQIWFTPGATCQYYPLTFSVFWLGYHLWGLNTVGFHLLNVAMHGTVAILLWRVLSRLKVRGAWLAAGIFALHPVCVMSVAWMTELKNTLSATLALCAALAYLRAAHIEADERGGESKLDWRFYCLSLVLFQLALFAKTAVTFLPVTLLLVAWWKGRRLDWRTIWPLLPMLALAMATGLFTVLMERSLVGPNDEPFHLSAVQRVLLSGESFWFYLSKFVFPYPLSFLYAQWPLAGSIWWEWAFPIATLGLMAGLWYARERIGKGPFVVCLHYYLSTSFLVLIVVLYMMRYTYVADHWQYFGAMGMAAAAGAGIYWLLDKFRHASPLLGPAVCGLLLVVLGALTWGQCGMYSSLEQLWQTTIARNPNSGMAHGSLANYYLLSKNPESAVPEFQRSLELDPGNIDLRLNFGEALADVNRLDDAIAEDRHVIADRPDYWLAHCNLGSALDQQHKFDEALREFQRGADSEPTNDLPQIGLGKVLLEEGKTDDAILHFKKALALDPNSAGGHYNLGSLYARLGQTADATTELRLAVQLDPEDPMAHNNLGNLLYQQGQTDEAIAQFKETVRILPNAAGVRCNFGLVLVKAGRVREAADQFEKAAQLQPDLDIAWTSLRAIAWRLATSPADPMRDGTEALRLARELTQHPGGDNAAGLATLAAAYAENGRYPDAIAAVRRALDAAPGDADSARLRDELAAFQSGRPFRDQSQRTAADPSAQTR